MNLKTGLLVSLVLISSTIFASIDSQMVNLNIQIKGKEKIFKSDLAMPFYQTAELEKKIDNKNYRFELNPKKGKNPLEVEIELKLYNKAGSKVIAKKDIITKLNKETVVSVKGIMFKLTPAI